MPASKYVRGLRSLIGHRLLLLPSVCAVVRDPDGKVLLVKSADFGTWDPPGGGVEPEEAPQDAAVREVREETGLSVKPLRLVGVYGGPELSITYPNGDATSYVMSAYECRLVSGELAPELEEVSEARFFSEQEVVGLGVMPWVSKVLKDSAAARNA